MNSLATMTMTTTPMNNLAQQLQQIGLRALPTNLDDFLARATKGRWCAHMLLEQMAQAEVEDRGRRSLEQRLRISGIKQFKPVAYYDWTWPTKIEREVIDRAHRSHEVNSTAFDAQPPDLPPVSLMDMGFAIMCSLARHRRPRIRFLFIGSHLCSTLLSGPASRRVLFHPCASL